VCWKLTKPTFAKGRAHFTKFDEAYMNILNMIREQFSPELLGQISKSIGESPQGTKSALEHSLPVLLGSAAAEASSPKGATDLFNALKRGMSQQGEVATASSLLGSPGGGGGGASFVSSLLGPKLAMIRDYIASKSGIRSGSAGSLLGVGGSLLMSALGKQVMGQGLDASALGQLLRSQIPHLKGLIPSELTNMLGIGNLFGTSEPAEAASSYASSAGASYEAAKPSVSGAKALRWALLVLALLLCGVFFYRHSRKAEVGGTREETITQTGTGYGVPQTDIASFMDQMKGAITRADGTPLDLRGMSFDSLGDLSGEAKTKLSALGKMVNNYPELKMTVLAYGKTADEAASKANSIKTVLANAGLSTERIAVQEEVGQGWPKVSFNK